MVATTPTHHQSSQQAQQIVVTVQNAAAVSNGTSGIISNRIKNHWNFNFNEVSIADKKMLFDCSSELLKKFRYPWEMMPIMYALAKYANGNIDEVLQRIDEGTYKF
jgi:hypothetical protein